MFEKTLTDIVKGIRASKRDTGLYISQCLAEIKLELASADMYTKANALQKLTFLQMMGYSMGIASFCTIEVMSSSKFAHKRIGYLAAVQGFTAETDVILLTTNLLQKELRAAAAQQHGSSPNNIMKGVYEAGLAMNCIANIVTPGLARDLLPELTALLDHPQPHLRKKAVLCLFQLFLRYPQGLRITFAKLQQCLDDADATVVSAAVNVITELSIITNPRNYLPLAPAFFQLVSNSNNNWMLIKVVKLLGSLVTEEPRLARKLLDPLAKIVRKTQAKSLLYEACYTITLCLPYCQKNDGSMPANAPAIIELCANTLCEFVQEPDQNLKYLGLVGFGSLLQSQPRVLFMSSSSSSNSSGGSSTSSNSQSNKYRALILPCLSDPDVTIRSRALSLLPGLASRKNWAELLAQLVPHVQSARGNYKRELCRQMIAVCRSEKYSLVGHHFEWYWDNVLLELSSLRGLESEAELLQQQLLDVVLRVLPLRVYAVRRCMEVLLDARRPEETNNDNNNTNTMLYSRKQLFPEVLGSVGWIIGEYSDLMGEAERHNTGNATEMEFYFDADSRGTHHAILQALLLPANLNLPHATQSTFVQASFKVLAAAATAAASNDGSSGMVVSSDQWEACRSLVAERIPVFCQSSSVEVMERSFGGLKLLESLRVYGDSRTPSPVLAPAAGDLLSLGGDNSSSNQNQTPPPSQTSNTQAVASTLTFLLKPSPMKPSGAKAQRKKNETLKVSADLSVFDALVKEEVDYRKKSSPTASEIPLGAVSFTQQRLARVEAPRPIMDGISSSDIAMPPTHASGGTFASSAMSTPGAASSGSYTTNTTSPTTIANSSARKGDPFYLDSGTGSGDAENDSNTPFGMIKLSSDEGDDPRNSSSKRRKKKKDKKKANGSAKNSLADPFATFQDVSSTSAAVTPIYHDGDDDDSDDEGGAVATSKQRNRKGTANGLSKIDLTKPLEDDHAAILPNRSHHRVADRSRQETSTSKSKTKKSKKSKKDKKKNLNTSAAEGDLLDLAFGSPSGTTPASTATPLAATSTMMTSGGTPNNINNNVNSAFDDLLGLTAGPLPPQNSLASTNQTSAAAPPSPLVSMNGASASSSSSNGSKRPWMKATVKGSEWSTTTVLYQAFDSSKGTQAATKVVVRVQNSGTTPLMGAVMDLKELGNGINIGTVAAGGGSFESTKLGKVPFASPHKSLSIQGTVACGLLGTASLKLSLPIAVTLEPDSVSMDHLAEELSSAGAWYSHSSKVHFPAGTHPNVVTDVIRGFLQASDVVGGSAAKVTSLAARSSLSGAPVRVMVKIKPESAKVDVKSTNDDFAKAIASDLKRLQVG